MSTTTRCRVFTDSGSVAVHRRNAVELVEVCGHFPLWRGQREERDLALKTLEDRLSLGTFQGARKTWGREKQARPDIDYACSFDP